MGKKICTIKNFFLGQIMLCMHGIQGFRLVEQWVRSKYFKDMILMLKNQGFNAKQDLLNRERSIIFVKYQ